MSITHFETQYGDAVHATAAMRVRCVRLRPDAVLPTYAHDGDSGMDLYLPESIELTPFVPMFVDIGLALEVPRGYEAQIRCRSGLTKRGLTACSGLGTVDSTYRGSIGIILIWHTDQLATWALEEGSRIAQLVIAPVVHAELVEVASVDELTQTSRAQKGFGSSGA